MVGPCSVHDADAAREYAERLSAKAAEVSDELCVAMRVYFEKPRTTTGWKGMINDPHLDGSGDVNLGLRLARGLLLEVLALGLPVGCEFLDPITPQYISDTVSWGAIGARTTESQIHRQLGSGPVDAGGLQERHGRQHRRGRGRRPRRRRPHAFAGIEVNGTPGGAPHQRQPRLPHHPARRARRAQLRAGRRWPLRSSGWRRPASPERLVVDASHDNSGKDHRRQPGVVVRPGRARWPRATARSSGSCSSRSSSRAARRWQPASHLTYGQSITDACMSWDTTVEVIDELAAAVRARRDGG